MQILFLNNYESLKLLIQQKLLTKLKLIQMLREQDILIENDDEILLKAILTRLSQLRIINFEIKSVEFNKFTINIIHADFKHRLILTHLTFSNSICIFIMLHHLLQQDLKQKDTHISHVSKL